MANLPPKPPPGLEPLPPGWTEHKAPTGHTYYYNKETKQSTYKRPSANLQNYHHSPPPAAPAPIAAQGTPYNQNFIPPYGANPVQPPPVYNQYNPWPGNTGNDLPFQQHPFSGTGANRVSVGQRGGHNNFADRRRPPPQDKPKHRYEIPNCAPWVLVKTKLGRRFVWNKDTNESFWKFPEDVMKAVVEFDRREREKKEQKQREDNDLMAEVEAEVAAAAEEIREAEDPAGADAGDGNESSEYEEVEVTDDEEDEQPSKRQRTEEPAEDQPMEMGEDDMAWMLEQMEQDQGEEEEEGLPFTEEDQKALFKDLLDDYQINPYHPWDKIINEGRLFDDDRYKALPNMDARKQCWQQWAKERIQVLKEERAKQEKKDPKIPYVALLQKYATPKLYWPEFRRKYKKEPEMKDMKLSDKDREKLYREHIKRLALPQSTLKSDLSALLKAQPISTLNRSTTLNTLPPAVLTDIRFISLPTSTRDQLVETYIATLPPAPEGAGLSAEEEAEAAKKRSERERREKALAERERRVEEQKRKQRRELEYGKGRLREEEMEIERAMKVGKEGLKSHFGGE